MKQPKNKQRETCLVGLIERTLTFLPSVPLLSVRHLNLELGLGPKQWLSNYRNPCKELENLRVT